jgi:hypothetical protein
VKFKTAVDDYHEHANEEHDHQRANKRKVDSEDNFQNTVGVQNVLIALFMRVAAVFNAVQSRKGKVNVAKNEVNGLRNAWGDSLHGMSASDLNAAR